MPANENHGTSQVQGFNVYHTSEIQEIRIEYFESYS